MAKVDAENIEDRLRILVKKVARTHCLWKEMEVLTGIPASSWVDFNRGKKRATATMIEAVSRKWPEYAFWLATGLTNYGGQHVAPEMAVKVLLPPDLAEAVRSKMIAGSYASENEVIVEALRRLQTHNDREP